MRGYAVGTHCQQLTARQRYKVPSRPGSNVYRKFAVHVPHRTQVKEEEGGTAISEVLRSTAADTVFTSQ